MFTQNELLSIAQLKKFAESNIISQEYSLKVAGGEAPPVGELPSFRVMAGGVRIVFSVMEVGGRAFRRLSVSSKLNQLNITNEFLELFGFHRNATTNLWTERDGRYDTIVNAAQKCDTDEVMCGNKLLRKAATTEQVQPLST